MKWLGAALLVFSGAAVGFGKTAAIRRRILLLERLTALLFHIQTELRQRGTPLPDILEGYSSHHLPLKTWANELRAGHTVLQTVSPWLDKLDADTGHILTELCTVLGRYDGETQALACDHAIHRLEEQTCALRRQITEKGRLYHIVPLTLGLVAAVALF